ncbi:OLC1v1006536C2 [Oldenlandia corymbosa var. corymbosa]|uniref:OLC1v1006536C2 n=1 Tax=Oldenlandia corymbosa var. corymbosa TaxID=529605 RepID=A0AAV1DHK7_OLDCO|nr:OLC1v1006536C2 [Oldenlandia corymbosa var. corymbosa]
MKETLILFICSFFIFNFLIPNVVSQSDDSCNSNLSSINSQLPFDTTSFNCNSVWASQGFILRYSKTGPGEWSFVLSAPNSNSNAYVAIGFSPNGKMVGSSAIVGWVGSDGLPIIKRYFLGGQSPAEVVADRSNLQVGNASKALTSPSRIYLAFQLTNTDQPTNRIIYAVGPSGLLPSGPPNFRLVQHSDYISTVLNYATGQTQTKGSNTDSLRRSHGILVIISWGIMMQIGALVARYMRQWDPIWFYSHAAIQSLSFILGVAGIICGLVLSNRVSTDVDKHKAIGIVVLIIGCLQVLITSFILHAVNN